MTVGGGALGVIVALVLGLVFGVDVFGGGSGYGSLSDLNNRTVGSPSAANGQLAATCKTGAQANHPDCRIVGWVNSIQSYWTSEFTAAGSRYPLATTRLSTGQVSTAAGRPRPPPGRSTPADKHVCIDLSFFNELGTKFGAKGGPFAEAYVLAHEYGHHVQDTLGVVCRASAGQGAQSQSVRIELQADCYAGIWAHNATATVT